VDGMPGLIPAGRPHLVIVACGGLLRVAGTDGDAGWAGVVAESLLGAPIGRFTSSSLRE